MRSSAILTNFLLPLLLFVSPVVASRIPENAGSDTTFNSIGLAGRQLRDSPDPEPTCTPQGLPCGLLKCCDGLACMGFHAYPHSACIPCPPEWTTC